MRRLLLTWGLVTILAAPAAMAAEYNYALGAVTRAYPLLFWAEDNSSRAVDGQTDLENAFRIHQAGQYPCWVEVWFPRNQALDIGKVVARVGPEHNNTAWTKGRLEGRWENQWVALQTFDGQINMDKPQVGEGEPRPMSGVRVWVEDSDWWATAFGEIEAWGAEGQGTQVDVRPSLEIKPQGRHAGGARFEDGRVFDLATPVQLAARLANPDPDSPFTFTLKLQVQDFFWRPVADLPAQELTLRPEQQGSCKFSWLAPEQGPYLVELTAWLGESLVGVTRDLIGVRDPELFATGQIEPLEPAPDLQPLTPEQLVGPGKMLTGCDQVTSAINMPGTEENVRIIKEAGFDKVNVWNDWMTLEPLPGVYNFKRIDETIRAAEKHNLGVGIEFGHTWDRAGDPQVSWLAEESIVTQNGTGPLGRWHDVAWDAPRARRHLRVLARLLANRYGKHPLLASWIPCPLSIESGIAEDPFLRVDYSIWAHRGFQNFLREAKGWTLAQVNQRYGTAYGQWEDVPVPRPFFEISGQTLDNHFAIDDRLLWLDWMEYREEAVTRRTEEVLEILKQASPEVPMYVWNDMGWGMRAYWPMLAKYECSPAFCAMGSGRGCQDPRHLLCSRRFGIPYRVEHHLLFPGTMAKWEGTIYDVLRFEALYFDWLYGPPRSPKVDKGPAFYHMQRMDKLMGELRWAPKPPAPVGYLFGMMAYQLQGQGGNWNVDPEGWSRMMAIAHYYAARHRFVEPYDWNGPLGDLQNQQVVYADMCRMIQRSAAKEVSDWVKRGGKLVVNWAAGQYALPPWGKTGYVGAPAASKNFRNVPYQVLQPTYPLLQDLKYRGFGAFGQPQRQGVLQVVSDHAALRGLDGASVQYWQPLDPEAAPAGARVLATIQGQPAALLYPLGEGQVLLMGFELGYTPAGEYWAYRIGEGTPEGAQVFGEAMNQTRDLIGTLLDNLYAWIGVPVDLEGPPEVYGMYGENLPRRYAFLFNPQDQPATGTVWTFPTLPEGNYQVTLMTVAEDKPLDTKSAAALRTGGVAVALQAQQFMAIRLEPVE